MTWYDMVSQLQACRGPINTWAKRQTLRPLPAFDMLLKQSGLAYQGNQAGEEVVGRRWPHDELDGGQQAQLHVQHVLHTACNAMGVWADKAQDLLGGSWYRVQCWTRDALPCMHGPIDLIAWPYGSWLDRMMRQ